MYYHLDFCIYHLQIQILPRKCLALLTAPINSFPTVNLYPQSTRPRPREVELMIMSLKKCTNWAVNQPVDVAKKLFWALRLFLSSLGWAEENILMPDCYTLIPLYSLCTMFRSTGGYTVTRLQCKVFQINRTNVCHLCSFLSPLNHCVYKIVCNQWAARCGFEEPSFVAEALYATVRCSVKSYYSAPSYQHRSGSGNIFSFSLYPAPWWTAAPVTSINTIQCHAILCLYQINQNQKNQNY